EAASDLKMLTESLEASGDIDGAAAQFERVLNLKLRVVGLDLDTIADAQWELATRYMGWGRYSRARELLMEAVGTFKRTGGARLARGYEALGQLEEDTGHYYEALRELARAGKVWESVKAQHVMELIRNLEHRVFLFDLLRQHKEAAYLREQAEALAQAARWAEAGCSPIEMFDSLRSNLWSGPKAPRLEAWSLDRNRDRTEGERLLRARRHAEAEIYLERAAVDAEKRGHSAPKRIQVR